MADTLTSIIFVISWIVMTALFIAAMVKDID